MSKNPNSLKAVGLISGGLDSTLAVKVVQDLGVKVYAVYFALPWGCGDEASAIKTAESLNIPLKIIHLDDAYLEIIKNPKHGRGAALNPCVDCKIYMLKKAKQYMQEIGASFIFTGEVLGQRPMSQLKRSLNFIERKSELQGLLLRPLTAQLLEPTIPEKEGLIDRNKLLNFSGRGRRNQIDLAKKYGITKYKQPAGGCLLTYKEFSSKIEDVFKYGHRDQNEIISLKWGRHYRLNENFKAILGRNDKENDLLVKHAHPEDYIVDFADVLGPTLVLKSKDSNVKPDGEVFKRCSELIQKHSKYKNHPPQKVIYRQTKNINSNTIELKPTNRSAFKTVIITLAILLYLLLISAHTATACTSGSECPSGQSCIYGFCFTTSTCGNPGVVSYGCSPYPETDPYDEYGMCANYEFGSGYCFPAASGLPIVRIDASNYGGIISGCTVANGPGKQCMDLPIGAVFSQTGTCTSTNTDCDTADEICYDGSDYQNDCSVCGNGDSCDSAAASGGNYSRNGTCANSGDCCTTLVNSGETADPPDWSAGDETCTCASGGQICDVTPSTGPSGEGVCASNACDTDEVALSSGSYYSSCDVAGEGIAISCDQDVGTTGYSIDGLCTGTGAEICCNGSGEDSVGSSTSDATPVENCPSEDGSSPVPGYTCDSDVSDGDGDDDKGIWAGSSAATCNGATCDCCTDNFLLGSGPTDTTPYDSCAATCDTDGKTCVANANFIDWDGLVSTEMGVCTDASTCSTTQVYKSGTDYVASCANSGTSTGYECDTDVDLSGYVRNGICRAVGTCNTTSPMAAAANATECGSMSGCSEGTFDGDESATCTSAKEGSVCISNVTTGVVFNGVCVEDACRTGTNVALNCGTDGCTSADISDLNMLTLCSFGRACDSSVDGNGFVQNGTCADFSCDTSGEISYDGSFEYFSTCAASYECDSDATSGGNYLRNGFCAQSVCATTEIAATTADASECGSMSGCEAGEFRDGDEAAACASANEGTVCSTAPETGSPPTADGICIEDICDTANASLNCGTDGCTSADLNDANLRGSCGSTDGYACEDGAIGSDGFTQEGTCTASGCDTSGEVCFDGVNYQDDCSSCSDDDACDSDATSGGDFSANGVCSSGACFIPGAVPFLIIID